MKAVLVAAVALVGVACLSGGCTEQITVTQEFVVDESLGSAAVTDVEIEMGAGRLMLTPGATGLVSGTIRYNMESWKPKITRSDSRLSIKQGAPKDFSGLAGKVVNDWNLQLGKAPMRLKVSAGVYQGTYELGGLTLQKLTIKDGAAHTQVSFNIVNPGQMESLEYQTGASSVTLIGLANANFKTMKFKGGAGDYSLDFSGELRSDGTVEVEAGAGTVRIIVPAATPARVTVDASLAGVSTEGVWTVQGETYSTTAVGTVGRVKMLTIAVEMDVGSLRLIAK
ncbi:MAG: toast rack family protein [Actinomycetia bacterium]|nr:toast rack family protein [Actinomycetes bacterium]